MTVWGGAGLGDGAAGAGCTLGLDRALDLQEPEPDLDELAAPLCGCVFWAACLAAEALAFAADVVVEAVLEE